MNNDNNNNNNNNNNRIQRRYSRFFTISSQRREPSPTRTLKWPRRSRAQITCNTSSAYHVQVSAYHMQMMVPTCARSFCVNPLACLERLSHASERLSRANDGSNLCEIFLREPFSLPWALITCKWAPITCKWWFPPVRDLSAWTL